MAASSVALLATMLIGGATQAANNRTVYFGSPAPGGSGGGYNPDGSLKFGALTNTPVTQGKKWATEVVLQNAGTTSTLNHVKMAGGAEADGKLYNPLFPKPTTGNSLTGGATFASVVVLEGSATCDPTSGASIACDVGTLAAGAFVKFLVVVNAPAAKGNATWWLTASWNEGWSSTGTNADYNFATGTVNVKESNCGSGQSSYFIADEFVDLTNGGVDCAAQDASVKSNGTLTGIGGFASLLVDATYDASPCPAGFKCLFKTVSADILDGTSVPGGVQWTVKWVGTKTIKAVIHYGDGYATDSTDFMAISLTKANKCSTTKLTDCWISVVPSNVKPGSVTVTFVTDSNGKAGGGF